MTKSDSLYRPNVITPVETVKTEHDHELDADWRNFDVLNCKTKESGPGEKRK